MLFLQWFKNLEIYWYKCSWNIAHLWTEFLKNSSAVNSPVDERMNLYVLGSTPGLWKSNFCIIFLFFLMWMINDYLNDLNFKLHNSHLYKSSPFRIIVFECNNSKSTNIAHCTLYHTLQRTLMSICTEFLYLTQFLYLLTFFFGTLVLKIDPRYFKRLL